jgi:hypothetical protein
VIRAPAPAACTATTAERKGEDVVAGAAHGRALDLEGSTRPALTSADEIMTILEGHYHDL